MSLRVSVHGNDSVEDDYSRLICPSRRPAERDGSNVPDQMAFGLFAILLSGSGLSLRFLSLLVVAAWPGFGDEHPTEGNEGNKGSTASPQ